jgi:hypothetical protein
MTGKKVSGVRCQGTDDRGQRTDDRSQRTDVRRQKTEDGRQIGDEIGSRTRLRPMGRDYATAKDAEVGKRTVDCGS